jgi:hypothetical protein
MVASSYMLIPWLDAIDGGDVLIEGVVHVLVLEGGKDGRCRQV